MSCEPVPFSHSNVIYLDYNATCPIDREVADAMWPYLTNHFGNASSEHFFGEQPTRALRAARHSIARLLGVDDADKSIVFTSGATESINHILRVAAEKQREKGLGDHIITTQIEHPAVLQTARYLERERKFKVTYLKPDKYGLISPASLEAALTKSTILISIMSSNNEIGTINPMRSLVAAAKNFNELILFHSDTSQSIGKVAVHPKEWRLDFCNIAGHKIYAPKGIGALYINPSLITRGCEYNFLNGAKQEQGVRPGTENIAYCVGLGKAAEKCMVALKSDHMATVRFLRDLLHSEVMGAIPHKYHSKVRVNGHPYIRLPNTLSISFGFLRNTRITKKIFKYVACSTGAACHSGDVKLSYVLEACGVGINYGMGTLRLSIGRYTTEKDVVLAAKVIGAAVSELYTKQFGSKL